VGANALRRPGQLWLGADLGLLGACFRSKPDGPLALSKSAVNHYVRATMAFKQARFRVNVFIVFLFMYAAF
jgi:hypothetical protein